MRMPSPSWLKVWLRLWLVWLPELSASSVQLDDGPGWFGGSYGGGAQEFFKLLKAWRDEGSLEGLELSGH